MEKCDSDIGDGLLSAQSRALKPGFSEQFQVILLAGQLQFNTIKMQVVLDMERRENGRACRYRRNAGELAKPVSAG